MIERILEHVVEELEEDPAVELEDPNQQLPEERITSWDERSNSIYYCELCNQAFTSYDIFYDHRTTSPDERARAGKIDFEAYRQIMPGEQLPTGAVLGELSPCEGGDADGE